MRRADCKDVIEEAWKDGLNRGTPNGLCEGLKQCALALTSWSKSTFGRIPKRIKEKKKALGRLIEHDDDGQNGVEINRQRKEVNELLDEEEVWLQQRSRVQWLGEGDRNTKYFHHRAFEKRKKNIINGLWNEEGLWCSNKESIAATTIAYFEDIYTTTHPISVDEVTNLIPAKVTRELNNDLTHDFTMDGSKQHSSRCTLQKPQAQTVCQLFFIKSIGTLLVMMLLIWSLMCLIPMLHLLK